MNCRKYPGADCDTDHQPEKRCDVSSSKRKRYGHLMRLSQQTGKEGIKMQNNKFRYQKLKAEVSYRECSDRVDEQQQLEGMCVEFEAANSKWKF